MRSAGAPRDRPAGRVHRGNGPGSLPQLEAIREAFKGQLISDFSPISGSALVVLLL